MFVCGYGHMCVQVTVKLEEGFGSPVVGVTRVSKLLDMNTELNLGSLQEESALFAWSHLPSTK